MFKKEEFAVVLDFMPQGKAQEAKKEPVAQVVGETYFTLLEIVSKPESDLVVGERIYIGKDVRDKVDHIKGRIKYEELTPAAHSELDDTVRKIVKAREAEFVEFLNRAGAINIRAHALEQLPGIGKKHLADILDARDKQKFTDFEDVKARVPHIGNVEDAFGNRIMGELKGESKYYLFVKIPPKEDEEGDRRNRGYRPRRRY